MKLLTGSRNAAMSLRPIVMAVLLLVWEGMQAAADVIAISPTNTTSRFQSLQARFGAQIQPIGIEGMLVIADPIEACQIIAPPPQAPANETIINSYFALIKRGGGCDFDLKVLNAQKANYKGAIVYNNEGDMLTAMKGNKYGVNVLISSVFVGLDSGNALKKMNYSTGYTVKICPEDVPSLSYYFLPFISIMSVCLLFFAIYGVAKYVRDQRRRRKARLSRDHLKKLPIKKFKKGDEYDVCAICLDDYEEGQKLRILPCNHAFHCKCIDPWLTNNRRTCPICKRKVVPPGMADSDEESDSEGGGGDAPNENTPLLSGMETNDLSERGAVGGLISTPPPSPVPSLEVEDEEENDRDHRREESHLESLISVETDTSSADSIPMEEATLDNQLTPPSNVLSVTVHSENELPIIGACSSAPKA